MRKRISYSINKTSPGWPGNPTYSMDQITSIKKGDTANTYMLHLFNHFGTHMDAPYHFYEDGKKMCEFSIDNFVYEKPLLIDIPKKAGEKVLDTDLIPYEKEIACADLLMIRTGFGKKRINDPIEYSQNGPAISSDAAKYLVNHFQQKIKAIAVDFISLASYSDSADGDLAHQYMCGKFQEKTIFIIEDVNMDELQPDKIVYAEAIPLYIDDVDSSPVTMWVEII